MPSVALGALLAFVIATGAYAARALSHTGALAAFVVGTIVFSVAHWDGAAVLFAFFLPSTILSRIGRARKKALVDVGKTGARDAWQVLANGGVAALCALLAPHFGTVLMTAFAGAFAAASADTWGTEIGTLAKGRPRSILTFAPLPTGLSGGITIQGTVAEIAGAAVVALTASALHLAAFVPVFAAGVVGATIDSVLGASAQSLRWCARCERACETNPHVCGEPTTLRRGFAWLENDAVNLAATLCGAAIGAVLAIQAH